MSDLPLPEIGSKLLLSKEVASYGNFLEVRIHEDGQALVINRENGLSWKHFNQQMLPIAEYSDKHGAFDITYKSGNFTRKAREEETEFSGSLSELSTGIKSGTDFYVSYDALTQAAKTAPAAIRSSVSQAIRLTGSDRSVP